MLRVEFRQLFSCPKKVQLNHNNVVPLLTKFGKKASIFLAGKLIISFILTRSRKATVYLVSYL